MKKKVLFITEALWIGGIETALVNLLNRMDYDKYEVTCLVLRASLEIADRITPKCRLLVADREASVTFHEPYRFARLYHLTEHSENPSKLHQAMMWAVPIIKWVENRLYIRYVRKRMKSERFDTCIIYSDRTAETAVRAISADKYLMFYHHGAMRKVYHDEIGYRKSKIIIAVSEGQENQLRRFRPAYAHKMMTIHNLLDIEGVRSRAIEPVEETFEADRFHIVSCGRIAREKGMDLAVEAAAQLVARGYKNIHWWIVGGGPAEREVHEKITQLNMQNHVTLLGMKSNPYPYIFNANLYVQPSRVESFGLTIAEAMVLGKFVVATDTDGAEVWLCNRENGHKCEISAEGIAKTVVNYLENASGEFAYGVVALELHNQEVMRTLENIL